MVKKDYLKHNFVLKTAVKDGLLLIETSNLLRQIGVNDSISSLLNKDASTGNIAKYGCLWEQMQKNRIRGKYHFSFQDFVNFANDYEPRTFKAKSLWRKLTLFVFDEYDARLVRLNNVLPKPVVKIKEETLTGKPPIGVVPRYLAEENRMIELQTAIIRYATDKRKVNMEWVEEYNELADRYIKRNKSKIGT
jgi:hypothetical protein